MEDLHKCQIRLRVKYRQTKTLFKSNTCIV